MDRSQSVQIADLTSQIAELRAVNAELGRALAAADAGTPLRSSITAALTLSRIEDAEQKAALARVERDAACAERDAAGSTLHDVRHALAQQSSEIQRLSEELTGQKRATEAALAELESGRATLSSTTVELEQLRTMLSRRSVRTAQQAARAATPFVEMAHRLRGKVERSPTEA